MADKPNVLFIMTDQQRFDALAANGNDIIHTPNLDALARSGLNVQGYYTNCPVCVPSRCTLFTGRYPHSHRVRENHNLLEAGREMHLFRVLKQEGYAIGYAGKNHLLEKPEMANFDFSDTWGCDHEPTEAEKELDAFYKEHRNRMQAEGRGEIWRAGLFHDFPDEATRTWQTAEAGVRFLRDERPADRPFCMCLSFSDPHVPHLAPRRFQDLYPEDQMVLYPRREGELQEKARRFDMKWRAQGADRATEAEMRHYMAVYYAMITFVDEQVGRVLDTLREQGLEEDTLVVFTSDHGEFCFEHGLCKKDLVLLESVLHVPLLIARPGTIEPRVVDETMVEEVDVLPTVLDLLGVQVPFGVQGRSLLPYLAGERGEHRDAVCGEICPPWLYNKFETFEQFKTHHGGVNIPFNVPGDYNKAARTREYRYIWYGTGEEELYDLARDPLEQYNVAGDPAYADALLAMKLRLLEWNALTEDPLDPLSIRQLQAHYDNWETRQDMPGVMAGPGWLEERFRPNPREM